MHRGERVSVGCNEEATLTTIAARTCTEMNRHTRMRQREGTEMKEGQGKGLSGRDHDSP